MKHFRTLITAGLVAVNAGALYAATPAESALAYAPADTDIVVSVDAKRVVESKIVQEAVAAVGGGQVEAKIQVLKNLTGIDPLKDIDHVWLWGKHRDDDSIVVLVQGRLKPDALLALIKANDKYKATDVQGTTVHEWYDNKDAKPKFGAMFPDGSVAIFNTIASAEKSLSAKAKNDGILTGPKVKLMPPVTEGTAAWGFVVRPDVGDDMKKHLAFLPASAAAAIKLTDTNVEIQLAAKADSATAAQDWVDIAKGALAAGRLQNENEIARKIAASGKAAVEDGDFAKVQISASIDDLRTLAKLKKKDKITTSSSDKPQE